MRQIGAYTIIEDGEEKFYTILDCECHLQVMVGMFFEEDLPCPLHEEYRYFYDFNDGKPHRK
jgi:hypothetical protein